MRSSMGVTVNAIGPAYVRTRLVAKQIADQARVQGAMQVMGLGWTARK